MQGCETDAPAPANDAGPSCGSRPWPLIDLNIDRSPYPKWRLQAYIQLMIGCAEAPAARGGQLVARLARALAGHRPTNTDPQKVSGSPTFHAPSQSRKRRASGPRPFDIV